MRLRGWISKIFFFAAFAAFVSSLTPAYAEVAPYTVVILAEGPTSQARAAKLRLELLKSDPYRRMGKQFVVKVANFPPTPMPCAEKTLAGGDLDCDFYALGEYGRSSPFFGHAVIVIPDRTPFRTTTFAGTVVLDRIEPSAVALHELAHTLLFDDEYPYGDGVSPDLMESCDLSRDGVINTASFRHQGSYASARDVLSSHQDQIPWSAWIPAGEDLVHDGTVLGSRRSSDAFSAAELPFALGLFPIEVCKGKSVFAPLPDSYLRDGRKGPVHPLYLEWTVRQMASVRGAPIEIHPPLNAACITQLTTGDLAQLPEMREISIQLHKRLDPLLPRSTQSVAAGLFALDPSLKQRFADLDRSYPGCTVALNLRFNANGDLLFGKPDQNQPLPRYSAYTGVRGQKGMDALNLESFSQCARSLTPKEPSLRKCQDEVIAISSSMISRFPTPKSDPIWRGAYARLSGQGEAPPTWGAALAQDQLSGDAAGVIGKELYQDYIKSLRQNNPLAPGFDCPGAMARRTAVSPSVPAVPRAGAAAAGAR